MKIFIAAFEPERLGGGWSFQRNFAKIMTNNLSAYADADVFFITSASMVQRADVEQAKRDGKKIVLRVDNIIRNSRNRNTGMSRMRDIAQLADLVVYQSGFAVGLLHEYLKPDNWMIILNSADQDTFNVHGCDYAGARYLYAKYSSDETKNWEMARSAFQSSHMPGKQLNLVGRFDAKLEEYGFDFYLGERLDYKGLIDDPHKMAQVYKDSDILLYSYFNDACSNTLIEALSCGLEIHDCYGMLQTGGAPEIMSHSDDVSYFGLPRMGAEYLEAINGL